MWTGYIRKKSYQNKILERSKTCCRKERELEKKLQKAVLVEDLQGSGVWADFSKGCLNKSGKELQKI